jgi:Zn/Cd-binding protein ZinT
MSLQLVDWAADWQMVLPYFDGTLPVVSQVLQKTTWKLRSISTTSSLITKQLHSSCGSMGPR